MLAISWHKLLTLSLWISPHVLLCVLVVILYKRRLYRQFPCFFAYALYEIGEFILMFTLRSTPSITGQQYANAYYGTLLLSVALRFGVIDEVSRDLFRNSQFLQVAAKRSLFCITALLMLVSVLLAVYEPGGNTLKWIAGVSVVNRGAAMVQLGLLLSLLLISRFLGLSWRSAAFGITLGLGILTSIDFATYALRAEFTSGAGAEVLNLLKTGSFFICVLIWIRYSLAPELEPALTVAAQDEVETWNKELQQWLR